MLPKAISRPLTKVYSSQDNLSVEDEIILNELKHTQEAFINLFTTLGIQCVTPTLIKRSVEKPSPVQTQGSGTMKGENFVSGTQKGEKSKEAIETEEEQQQNSNNDQNLDYERKLFQLLLSEENLSCEDLEPSELFHALSLDLSPDFAKTLAWMLLREGNNEKGRESLYEKKRKLHPLWEEYKLSDESLLYFNPFTGQLCIEIPKSSQDCSGGIVANMDPQERIEIMAELIYTNIYDKEMKNDLSALNSKKKNLTFSQGRNSLSNAMKESLPPAKTLIIVPVSSLYFWESSLSRFSREDNPLKLLVYYGQKRSQEFQNLGMFDIVLTTYGIISGEFTGDGKRDLYNYDWFRVVLDEAHYIKGKRIQTTKAIEELNILHRWCLSSLTLQNRLEDLYNMVSFLKLEPWSNLTWWNVHLNKPLEKGDQNAFDVLKTILGPVMLNLNNELCVGKKVTKSSQLMVQERKYRIEYVQLTKKELDYYVCLFQKSKTEFDKFIGQDALIENYTQAIELVVRIRQACDHLFLIYSKFEVKDSDCLENEIAGFFGTGNSDEEYHKRGLNDLNVLDEKSLKYKFHDHFEIIMDENTRTEQVIAIQKPQALVSIDIIHETVERLNMGDIVHCPLCLNDLENAVVTICGHILCSVCMKRSIMVKSMCPVCNTILTRKDCLVISRYKTLKFYFFLCLL